MHRLQRVKHGPAIRQWRIPAQGARCTIGAGRAAQTTVLPRTPSPPKQTQYTLLQSLSMSPLLCPNITAILASVSRSQASVFQGPRHRLSATIAAKPFRHPFGADSPYRFSLSCDHTFSFPLSDISAIPCIHSQGIDILGQRAWMIPVRALPERQGTIPCHTRRS